MVTTVVVLQHAEKVSAPGDPGLSARGQWQAQQAATHLQGVGPVALVSSPLLRARQTAQAVAAACSLDVTIDDRLRERLDWAAGQSGEQFLASWQRGTRERDWTPPQGRSSCDAARQVLSAVTEHAVQDQMVVLVCHGGVTVDLLRDLMGDEALKAASPGLIAHGVPGAALTELQRLGTRWRPARIARVDHLRAGERSRHRVV